MNIAVQMHMSLHLVIENDHTKGLPLQVSYSKAPTKPKEFIDL